MMMREYAENKGEGNRSIKQTETKLTMRSEGWMTLNFGIMATFVLISGKRWYLEIRSRQIIGDAEALSSQAAGGSDKALLEDDPMPVSACWHLL